MKLEGFGLMVDNIEQMVKFYRDVLDFNIDFRPDDKNVYLVKDGVLFLMYGRKDFEAMVNASFQYPKGKNGTFEIALGVKNYQSVDSTFAKVVEKGAIPVFYPTTMPWGQRACYIADPEGNLIEIGSFQKE